MGNKMLIDATHPEETRVVVLRGNRVEEFDFESASKKQLRGNIYLAKVTRVEPSLQAAFVNYGGNRHGFLAFSEIHPDYYQLPVAERQALKDEEFDPQAAGDDASENGVNDHADENGMDEDGAVVPLAADDDNAEDDSDTDRNRQTVALEAALPAAKYSSRLADDEDDENESETLAGRNSASEGDASGAAEEDIAAADAERSGRDKDAGDQEVEAKSDFDNTDPADRDDANDGDADDEDIESVGSEDALEELPQRAKRRRRSYKIQEVIKRGQILLVQVVKEERGNKGAALTTYLSLAGRYTVLMPNTGSGGGISRKIASPADRKRLREIATDLDVSEGMGLIIRTAGAARTKTEIKRDYEYLLRLWENVRDLTLKSTAPCLVYEEGDLIKRSIRDLYSREIDEVLVAGEDAYRDAKDFMRMLMPSHAKNVQPYKDPEPLFTRYEVERQLNAMFSPQVTLPSGGYIIINQTEALVAVDVNSGKSTREFSIEDTALKTNLEAAEEISRQLRLRDLAGLIVIDFIDMEERRNNRAVERKLKECLRNDRARIQVGRISHFGLMEMSRQRIRTGMVEGSTTQCSHCQGTGFVRSTESVALSVLRSLEDWLRTHNPCDLSAVCAPEVALYILNQKRGYLQDIEGRHNVVIGVMASDRMHGANFFIEKVSIAVNADGVQNGAVSQNDRIIVPFEADQEEAGDDQGRKSRRRRRRRRGRGDDQEAGDQGAPIANAEAEEAPQTPLARVPDEQPVLDTDVDFPGTEPVGEEDDDDRPRRRSRRRGRRGGRGSRGGRYNEAAESGATDDRAEPEQVQAEGDRPAGEAADEKEVAKSPEPVAPADVVAPEAEAKSPEQPVIEVAEQAPANTGKADISAEPGTDDEQPKPRERRSFRTARRRKNPRSANGSDQPNGFHEQKLAEDVGGEAMVEAESKKITVSEKAVEVTPSQDDPKPRGTKRGWWQRRAS